MLKVPKFPIRCKTKNGESFTALFKKIGDPLLLKVLITPKNKSTLEIRVPIPKDEILSWSALAITAFESFAPKASEPKEVPRPYGIVFVKDALPEQTYRTAQQSDPAKQYLCRLQGRSLIKDEFIIEVYFPKQRQWTPVGVPALYKLTIYNEKESSMPKVTTAPKPSKTPHVPVPAPKLQTPAKNAPQAHSSNGLTVYEAWGKAFEANGTKPDAPKQIVGFMTKQFPGRKTDWSRWVNPVRARYNAGKLPGVKQPLTKIKPYK